MKSKLAFSAPHDVDPIVDFVRALQDGIQGFKALVSMVVCPEGTRWPRRRNAGVPLQSRLQRAVSPELMATILKPYSLASAPELYEILRFRIGLQKSVVDHVCQFSNGHFFHGFILPVIV